MKKREIQQRSCSIHSHAKINLTLDVLGQRPDGYHELTMVMQTIHLCDYLCLTLSDEDEVRVVCTQPELATSENLAARAAQMLRHRLNLKQGLIIELQKRIPVAAGLGGGSSNAAAVLCALRRWWQLPLTDVDMQEMATSLGSDVPFFLTGGLALCTGRGEVVTPLTPYSPPSFNWLILLKPAIGVSTKTVYQALNVSDHTDGSATRTVCDAIQTQSDFALTTLHNSLERGVLECYPEVARARADLLQAGAEWAQLSGSGPTLFAPFMHLEKAEQTRRRLAQQGYEVYLTQIKL